MHGADEHSTIAAIATPPGRGGIAVLRLSGPDALAVLRRLFAPARSRAGGTPAQSGARDTTAPNEAVDLSTRSNAGALSARDGADNLSEQGGAEAPAAVRCGAGFVFQPRRLHYGRVLDGRGEILDEALAVYMPGPASATGDDVGELHCHAGPGICAALLEAAVAAGAVPAGPGDFTRRAFLNGRLDLTQAEAVAELCDARTGAGARLAAAKLGGALGRETARLRVALDDLRLQCVLDADFPEEEAEHLGEAAFRQRIDDCASTLRRLLSAYERARFWREGASAVLVGRVNAGKSSLLNALLGRERAIVSEAPGTTRDYLEESLNLGGLEVRLADTAGLRAGGGTVESEGMRRAGALAEQADLVIFVKDVRDVVNPEASDVLDPARSGNAVVSEERTPPSRTGQIRARAGEDHPPRATDTERLSRQHSPCGVLESVSEGGERPPCPNNFGEATLYPEEKDFLRLHRERCRRGGLIAVLNKIDTLPGPEAVRRALKEFSAVLTDVIGEYPPDTDGSREETQRGGVGGTPTTSAGIPTVPLCTAVSALRGDGLDALSEAVRGALTTQGRIDPGDTVPNLRQSALMRLALDELSTLEEERVAGYPRDMLALRLEHAARLLDEVSGASGNKELLDRIFSSFCIGK